MKKVYKKLTEEQKKAGIIFSSCLSTQRTEQSNDTIHNVYNNYEDKEKRIERLLNDKFFKGSMWKYNIIRQ